MKQVHKKKLYDTKTAERVGEFWNGYGYSDFHYQLEVIYVTKQGAWFIHAKGGAFTEYADHFGNSVSDGERIIPVSKDEALQWLTQHGLTEAIEKYFADEIEEA